MGCGNYKAKKRCLVRVPKKKKEKKKKKGLMKMQKFSPKKKIGLHRRVLKNNLNKGWGALEESLFCVMKPSVIFVSFSWVLN